MYFGEAQQAVAYFSDLGYVCPATFNPADYFIDFLSRDQRSANLDKLSRARIATLGDAFARTKVGSKPHPLPQQHPARHEETLALLGSAHVDEHGVHSIAGASSPPASAKKASKYTSTWWRQFSLLTKRSLLTL